MISVIIGTKNRPRHLQRCLTAFYNSFYQDFEVIVVDQSRDRTAYGAFKDIQDTRFMYIQECAKGKSNALNRGITIAQGDIIAFTDDDCRVDKNWIVSILDFFTHHPSACGVFGKTLPDNPGRHKNKICPCTFVRNKPAIITAPCLHYKFIGFGNNMAFRKKIFKTIGNFKPWLGPGSIGSNCEDGEIALRALIRGYSLGYNPDMIVSHNKWLTAEEMGAQQLSYLCGEMACYGYFYFQGYHFAKPIVKNNIMDSYYEIRKSVKFLLLLRWDRKLINNISRAFDKIVYRTRGLIIGFVYSLINPLD